MSGAQRTSARATALVRLTLTRFRSYAAARLVCDARPVVLTGPNGAGKTNLLEAISFLSPGRGLRRAQLAEVEQRAAGTATAAGSDWSQSGWAVNAVLQGPNGEVEIGTGREADGDADQRAIRINGQRVKSQAALAEHVAMVWLTPQMDRLFLEGASGRRRFLDRLVFAFDPGHAGRLNRYERALRERARLLQEPSPDPAWLDTLEDQMATTGVAVAAARQALVGRLASAAAQAADNFPVPGLAVAGIPEDLLAGGPALDAEEALRRALGSGRGADARTGGAAAGPHRSDFKVTHLAKQMPAELGSTGEQKALLVAIVLAHARLLAAETGRVPLLLLDEVAAHLDEGRRASLFEAILGTGAQAWMTGTDGQFFTPLGNRASHFRIADSRVLPEA